MNWLDTLSIALYLMTYYIYSTLQLRYVFCFVTIIIFALKFQSDMTNSVARKVQRQSVL